MWISDGQKKFRLRCLPYFLLLGVAKSGTSDFYRRTMVHPQIHHPVNKEVYWWHEYRFSANSTFSDYSDSFDSVFHAKSKKSYGRALSVGDVSSMVLGEFATMLFFSDPYWRENPVNENAAEPRELNIHHIRSVLPDVKLIVLLREPASRMYSHYNMGKKGRATSETFHSHVTHSIEWWNKCVKLYPRRQCAYGSPPSMPPMMDKLQGNPKSFWTNLHSPALRESIYVIYAKEWLSMFPKEQILFLKFEEYSSDEIQILKEQVYPFLNLNATLADFEHSSSLKIMNSPRQYAPMLPSTKDILKKFYQPFNEELAALLDDKKWLWTEN